MFLLYRIKVLEFKQFQNTEASYQVDTFSFCVCYNTVPAFAPRMPYIILQITVIAPFELWDPICFNKHDFIRNSKFAFVINSHFYNTFLYPT